VYFLQGHPAEVIGDDSARGVVREPAAARVAAAAEAMGCLPGSVAPGTALVPITTRVRRKRAPGEDGRRAPACGEEPRGPAAERGPPPRPALARWTHSCCRRSWLRQGSASSCRQSAARHQLCPRGRKARRGGAGDGASGRSRREVDPGLAGRPVCGRPPSAAPEPRPQPQGQESV
jgi:hypothetical protein